MFSVKLSIYKFIMCVAIFKTVNYFIVNLENRNNWLNLFLHCMYGVKKIILGDYIIVERCWVYNYIHTPSCIYIFRVLHLCTRWCYFLLSNL